MQRSRWFLVVLFLVASSVLAWACNGEEEEEPGAATKPAATTPAEKTPEPGKTPEAREDRGPFAELADKFKKATYKVTYQVSSTDAEQVFEGTMTWYKKGENLRIDLDSEVEGEKMRATIITRPDQSYFCTVVPELGEGGSCFSTPGEPGEGVGDIITGLEETLADPNLDVESTDSRKIAGEDADCFTVRTPDVEGEAEVCLSDEGVPLSSKVAMDGGEMSLEATEFSRDVSDADFEPPYPVSEGFPGLPEGE